MSKGIPFTIIMMACLTAIGCKDKASSIETIIMAYPNGETSLYVERNGQASLTYGALPQFQEIEVRTFDIDDLYRQLLPRLHANVPREEWPNPQSEYGTVTIYYDNKASNEYLIFDEKDFAEYILDKARKNRVDPTPEPWAF